MNEYILIGIFIILIYGLMQMLKAKYLEKYKYKNLVFDSLTFVLFGFLFIVPEIKKGFSGINFTLILIVLFFSYLISKIYKDIVILKK